MYREQVKLLSGMLHALVSAIDAKDPYTCGHSNRVARVSLRLAEQLNCSDEMKNTIYLSGILHDIGKIGISDQVLGKEGRFYNSTNGVEQWVDTEARVWWTEDCR